MIAEEQYNNLRDVAEELFGYSPCLHCSNYIQGAGSVYCRAFPGGDGIPEEIFFGKNLHKDPYPGDHGIQFDPED